MRSWLPATQLAIEECSLHLTNTKSENTSIDAYLTRAVLISLCAEMETTITQLLFERFSLNSDAEMREFANSIGQGFVRNAKTGEIAKILGRFGQTCKSRYEAALKASLDDEALARIGNAIFNRGQFAHFMPATVTFAEVKVAYGDAVKLVEVVATALGLPT